MRPVIFLKSLRTALLLMGVIAAHVMVARATTVTVQELSINPARTVNVTIPGFYQGGVNAGVTSLLVNGIQTMGFCIDLHDFSPSSPRSYSVVDLASAPEAPGGPMGASIAQVIRNLWTLNYTGALVNADHAAALQVAIWDQVILADHSLVAPTIGRQIFGSYDANQLISTAMAYTGASVNLIALTSNAAQDYVVLGSPDFNGSSVPDGGDSLMLLGLALIVLGVFRRRFVAVKC